MRKKKLLKDVAKKKILQLFKKLKGKVIAKSWLYRKLDLKKSTIDKACASLFKEGKLRKQRFGNNTFFCPVKIYWSKK